MSMNLHARVKDETIELWQTPTQITYTICVDENGVAQELRGRNARRALQAYIQWVKLSTNGAWKSLEALEEARADVKHHLEYVTKYLDRKGLVVYYL